MGIIDFLARNRGWLAPAMLVLAWINLFLPDNVQLTVIFSSFALILVGFSRNFDSVRYPPSQNKPNRTDKLIGLASLASVLVLCWLHYVREAIPDMAPVLFPVIAMQQWPRRYTQPQEGNQL
jgi:hypothetical protein